MYRAPDHFGQDAESYAKYRPRYPDELFRWVAAIAPGRRLAWDAATGNGQAAVALAGYFDRVIATDASAGQIGRAIPHPGVEYRVEEAGAPTLADATADAVTVAQALHWMDLDSFFKAVNRVLRPGGVLAIWTYGAFQVDQPDVNQVLRDFYYGEITRWWPDNRRLVEDGYRSITLPFDRVEPPPFDMAVTWTLPQLLGYVATWSAVKRCRAETGTDPVPALSGALGRVWGDPATPQVVRWPLGVLAGRKPEA